MTAQEQELLDPGTPAWRRLMTSSKVAAILGVSPWDSPRSMWHKMRNELPDEPQTEDQSRGHYLEPAILAWWRDRHPEHAEYVEQPRYTLGDWAAATPDATAMLGTEGQPDWHRVIIEAKSGRDLDEWGAPGTDELPPYYLVQVFWELHVSKVPICYVPIIGPFLEFEEYVVRYDPAVGAALEARCMEFFASLEAEQPPPLDDTPATYDAMRLLHRSIVDSAVEISPGMAREFIDALESRKAAQARERRAKSTVLEFMGEARYAECGGVRVARRQPNKTGFQLNQVAKDTTDLPIEGTES